MSDATDSSLKSSGKHTIGRSLGSIAVVAVFAYRAFLLAARLDRRCAARS